MNRVEEYLELHDKLEKGGIRGIIIQHAYTEKDIQKSMSFTMSAMKVIKIFQMFRGNTKKITEEINKRNLETALIKMIDALKKIATQMEIKTIEVVELDDIDEIKLV